MMLVNPVPVGGAMIACMFSLAAKLRRWIVPLAHVYVVVVGDMFTVPHESVVWTIGNTAAVPVPYVPAAHAAHTVTPAAEE